MSIPRYRCLLSLPFLLFSFIFTSYCLYLLLSDPNDSEPNQCLMSWMWPHYSDPIPIPTWNDSRYHLIRYKAGRIFYEGRGMVPEAKKSDLIVLFVPGNAGSFEQVRSIGQYADPDLKRSPPPHIDPYVASFRQGEKYRHSDLSIAFFSVDLEEEFSGISGKILRRQGMFLTHVLRYIAKWKRPIVLVSHSMGGIVVRLAMGSFTQHPEVAAGNQILLHLALAAPFEKLPLIAEPEMLAVYRGLKWWDDSRSEDGDGFLGTIFGSLFRAKGRIVRNDFTPTLLVTGGRRDWMVPDSPKDYCSFGGARWNLESISDSERDPRAQVFCTDTYTLPNVRVSADHQGAVWCNQAVQTYANLIGDIAYRVKKDSLPIEMEELVNRYFRSYAGPLLIDGIYAREAIEPVTEKVVLSARQKISIDLQDILEPQILEFQHTKDYEFEFGNALDLTVSAMFNVKPSAFDVFGISRSGGVWHRLTRFAVLLPHVNRTERQMEVSTYPLNVPQSLVFFPNVSRLYSSLLFRFRVNGYKLNVAKFSSVMEAFSSSMKSNSVFVREIEQRWDDATNLQVTTAARSFVHRRSIFLPVWFLRRGTMERFQVGETVPLSFSPTTDISSNLLLFVDPRAKAPSFVESLSLLNLIHIFLRYKAVRAFQFALGVCYVFMAMFGLFSDSHALVGPLSHLADFRFVVSLVFASGVWQVVHRDNPESFMDLGVFCAFSYVLVFTMFAFVAVVRRMMLLVRLSKVTRLVEDRPVLRFALLGFGCLLSFYSGAVGFGVVALLLLLSCAATSRSTFGRQILLVHFILNGMLLAPRLFVDWRSTGSLVDLAPWFLHCAFVFIEDGWYSGAMLKSWGFFLMLAFTAMSFPEELVFVDLHLWKIFENVAWAIGAWIMRTREESERKPKVE